MIVDNLNVRESAMNRTKTYPVCIIDSYAELSPPVAGQLLQMIFGWNTQIVEACGLIDHNELSEGCSLYILRQLSGKLLSKNPRCFRVCKALDHNCIIHAKQA